MPLLAFACQLRKAETVNRNHVGYPYQPIPQRKSLTAAQEEQLRQQPASRHRAGHNAGLHDESAPFITGYESAQDDTDTRVPARTMPRSAIRYRPLATTQPQAIPKKRIHWFVFVGLAIFIMTFGWIAFNAASAWIQTRMDDFTYGFPRTFQADANIGHYGRESHFICLNLWGEVEIIETQKGHPESSKIYRVVVLPVDQATVPATMSFSDINGDGKVDAIVRVGESEIPMYNNGTGFQSQPPGK
jgi:hypothetical protein